MGEHMLETALLVVSVLLIAIVLLQSNKATDGEQILSGRNSELFQHQKERGVELLITRITILLCVVFFVISFILFVK